MGYCKTCNLYHRHAHGAIPFLGRLLLSLIFILAAIGKCTHFNEFVQKMTQAGVESGPAAYIVLAIIFEFLGGFLILFGWHTRFGAALLMIFLLPVTLIFHPFWQYAGGEMFDLQLSNFLKNVAIFGGLLLLATYGPGTWSFDKSCCCSEKCDINQ
jgi:putative oxidoreductase